MQFVDNELSNKKEVNNSDTQMTLLLARTHLKFKLKGVNLAEVTLMVGADSGRRTLSRRTRSFGSGQFLSRLL